MTTELSRPMQPKFLVAAITAALGAPAFGQAMVQEALSPTFGDKRPFTLFDAESYFQEDVNGRDQTLQMNRLDFRLSVPLEQTERHDWTLIGRIKHLDVETHAILPDTFEEFPGSLWDVELGAVYRTRLTNDWILGGQFSIGSASDRLFAGGDEIIVRANGFLRVPAGNDAWMFFLSFSNNREFAQYIPVPGIAYEFNGVENLQAVLGVPYSHLSYAATDRLTLALDYFLIRRIRAEVAYELTETLAAYAEFEWFYESYLRHDREDDDDRLFYYEKRVLGGVRWDLNEQTRVDLSTGYAFDRFFFEGEDYGDRSDNRIGVSDGPFVRLDLKISF